MEFGIRRSARSHFHPISYRDPCPARPGYLRANPKNAHRDAGEPAIWHIVDMLVIRISPPGDAPSIGRVLPLPGDLTGAWAGVGWIESQINQLETAVSLLIAGHSGISPTYDYSALRALRKLAKMRPALSGCPAILGAPHKETYGGVLRDSESRTDSLKKWNDMGKRPRRKRGRTRRRAVALKRKTTKRYRHPTDGGGGSGGDLAAWRKQKETKDAASGPTPADASGKDTKGKRADLKYPRNTFSRWNTRPSHLTEKHSSGRGSSILPPNG